MTIFGGFARACDVQRVVHAKADARVAGEGGDLFVWGRNARVRKLFRRNS